MSASEQRQSERINFISTAILRYGSEYTLEARVDTRDISLQGVFVQTEQRIALNTPCNLEIDLVGNTSAMDFRVKGVIQRHDATGMAIAFTHLEPDSYLHILNLVKLHAST